MLIGVKKRFVFIANSKTASTSIEEALQPWAEICRSGAPERKHISWADASIEYEFLFGNPGYAAESFFRFGVVREPASWVVSWYNYRVGNPGIRDPLPGDMSFEQFWASGDWVKDISQKAKFVDADGQCRFDLIIPHELVSKCFPSILKALQIPVVQLPSSNVSVRKVVSRDSLGPELVAEINHHYQDDLEFYRLWLDRSRTVPGGLNGYIEWSSARAYSSATSLAHEMEPARKSRRWHVQTHRSPAVKLVHLDDLPPVTADAALRDLGGVVVLEPDATGHYRLIAVDAGGEQEVTWGIASPHFAAALQDNPRAKYARFRVDGLHSMPTQPLLLYLESDVHARELILTISIVADLTG